MGSSRTCCTDDLRRFLLAAVFLCVASVAVAQVQTGTIRGKVTDEVGGVQLAAPPESLAEFRMRTLGDGNIAPLQATPRPTEPQPAPNEVAVNPPMPPVVITPRPMRPTPLRPCWRLAMRLATCLIPSS